MAEFKINGAPSPGYLAGVADIGDRVINLSNGRRYWNSGTKDAPVWSDSTEITVSGFTAANFSKWRKAVATTRNGGVNAKHLRIGDSTEQGTGGDTYATIGVNSSPSAYLTKLFNSYYCPAIHALTNATSTQNTSPDDRWSYGTGWGEGGGYGAGSSSSASANNPAGNLVCTPGVLADRYVVYYIRNTGLGSLGITATGGGTTNLSCAGASSIQKVTVSAASANISNTVTISSTGGTVFVLSIEAYNSAIPQIEVMNAGVASSRASDWVNSPTTWGAIPWIQAIAPDLTVVRLSINDAALSRPVAAVMADIQLVVTAAKVSGDVIIESPFPSSITPHSTFEALYTPALAALAAQNNCGFIDFYSRFLAGGVYPANPFFADSLHLNSLGMCDVADAEFKAIMRI